MPGVLKAAALCAAAAQTRSRRAQEQ